MNSSQNEEVDIFQDSGNHLSCFFQLHFNSFSKLPEQQSIQIFWAAMTMTTSGTLMKILKVDLTLKSFNNNNNNGAQVRAPEGSVQLSNVK